MSLFPPPPIHPFERLPITDGLPINAERWRQAHAYHCQRQNLHYQALHQPGIVSGLGVRLIPPPIAQSLRLQDTSRTPADSRSQARRWVEVQPGIAIDLRGNPIVVTEATAFWIASNPDPGQPLTVYLVLQYVDPEGLETYAQALQQQIQVRETFRLQEKLSLPEPEEIELCRVRLHSDFSGLELPRDVLQPGANALDLRYRLRACPRPQQQVQAAVLADGGETALGLGLHRLLVGTPALCPTLAAAPLRSVTSLDDLVSESPPDLLGLGSAQFDQLQQPEVASLETYLRRGGTVLLELSTAGTGLGEVIMLEQQIKNAIAEIDQQPLPLSSDVTSTRQTLAQELEQIGTELQRQLEQLCAIPQRLAQQVGQPLAPWGTLAIDHPLRCRPYLFDQLPGLVNQPIQVMAGGGLVVIIGDLSSLWAAQTPTPTARHILSAAQEWGINLLDYAQRRASLSQLLTPS